MDNKLEKKFLSGNFSAIAFHEKRDSWQNYASLGLIASNEDINIKLEEFSDPIAKFYKGISYWIRGKDELAIAILKKIDSEYSQNLLSFIEKDTINILAQLPWARHGSSDFINVLHPDPKFKIKNISFHPDDYPNEPYADVLSFLDDGFVPDFYISKMVEWQLMPTNLQELPCPIFGHTGDYDLHIQAIFPWLHLFDELIVTDHTEHRDVSLLTGLPVSTFPKSFGVPDELPDIKTNQRQIDFFQSGSLVHPYHPDKIRPFFESLSLNNGNLLAVCNGFMFQDHYLTMLKNTKSTFTFVRHPGAMPTRGLEALAMGVAVAVQKGSSLSLYYGEGDGVFTYDPNGDGLKDVLTFIIKNWGDVQKCAQKGMVKVRRDFALSKVASQYFRFLTFLAAKPRPERKKLPTKNLKQKRMIVSKGWLPGRKEAMDRIFHANMNFWDEKDNNTFSTSDYIDYGREVLLEIDSRSKGKGGVEQLSDEDKTLIDKAYQIFKEGSCRHPKSLPMIFNLVRTAFHFGTPLQVRESIAISSNVLKQPVDRWLCYPYEDVFPWDFNASFFNYRGYFDKINEWLSTKCKKTKYLVNFIYASMHYYLSFYENDFEHAELAVKFDPNFDSYKYRLSQIILNKKDENNYGLAKKMFSELSNDSILFSEATALLYQFERDIEKNENVINWDKTYSEKFLTAQKNIHELKIPIRATDWKKTILRKKDDSDNSKGVSKQNIKIDGILAKNRHNNLRNIAILMPTLNRPEFLKRSLHYYAQMRFEGTIVVGDSSNELNRTINSETIDHQKNNLNILYGYFPDPPYLHDGMCMREMVNMTKTPYVVYSGDDDFLIPQGLSRCIQALEKENKLTAAFGTRINLKLDRAGAWGKPAAAQLCIGPDFMEDLPSQRLCKYLQNGLSTQYFVHRIDVWKKMYEHVVDVPSRYLGPEVLPCCFSAMQGKIKRLDTPTIVFQNNPNQVFSWDKTSLFDLINDDKWPPSIATILNTVSDQLVLNEKMDSEVARGFVKKELWAHVSGILLMQYKKRFMMGTPCDNIDMKSLKTIMADESMRKVLNPVIQVLIGNNGCKH